MQCSVKKNEVLQLGDRRRDAASVHGHCQLVELDEVLVQLGEVGLDGLVALDQLGPRARQHDDGLAGAVLHLFHRLHVVIAEGLEELVELDLAPADILVEKCLPVGLPPVHHDDLVDDLEVSIVLGELVEDLLLLVGLGTTPSCWSRVSSSMT